MEDRDGGTRLCTAHASTIGSTCPSLVLGTVRGLHRSAVGQLGVAPERRTASRALLQVRSAGCATPLGKAVLSAVAERYP